MLFISLFVKTDTRHLVCRPTLLPAAMAHSGALSPAPSRLRARLFPWFIPTLGRLGVGAPGENLLLSRFRFTDSWHKTECSEKDEGKLQSWIKVLGYFYIFGAFSNSHISCPSPHPTNNVGRLFPEFFSQFELCIGRGTENYKKISKSMYSFMVACVQTPPSLLRFLVVIHVFFEH